MCSEYNGWTNYETWNMNLWLTNDSSFYEIADDAIQVIVNNDYKGTEDKPIKIDKDDVVCQTAEWLKEHAYNVYLDGFDSTDYNRYGPIGDFVHASWNEINWYSIAEHIVDDWLENNKEEYYAILG
jgi:hypothetical protein